VGTHPDPHELAEQIREARRIGDVSEMVNVSVKDRTREVIVNADAGRARRPLLVVETANHASPSRRSRRSRTATSSSRISSITATSSSSTPREEEEDILVGVDEDDLTENHTHLEIDPSLIFDRCGHDPLPRAQRARPALRWGQG